MTQDEEREARLSIERELEEHFLLRGDASRNVREGFRHRALWRLGLEARPKGRARKSPPCRALGRARLSGGDALTQLERELEKITKKKRG